MRFLYILFIVMVVISCEKEVAEPIKPLPPKPIYTDTTTLDSINNLSNPLKGQTWVITGIRIGDIGNMMTINDTLVFLTGNVYSFNGNNENYSLYSTGSAYRLTLNNTPWGNISGTLYDNSIRYGQVIGLKFVDITIGSSNTTNYYLWMNKIK
jgi:hypothetical protein